MNEKLTLAQITDSFSKTKSNYAFYKWGCHCVKHNFKCIFYWLTFLFVETIKLKPVHNHAPPPRYYYSFLPDWDMDRLYCCYN